MQTPRMKHNKEVWTKTSILRFMHNGATFNKACRNINMNYKDVMKLLNIPKGMTPYINKHGKSGIHAYRIGKYHIDVNFRKSKKIYRYTRNGIGLDNLDHLKKAALAGFGLNRLLNKIKELRKLRGMP